jgi:hypothetical protein
LLVLHRQWQEFRKRMGFEWSGVVATAISWLLTFSAVCIGYVFFRSESVGQAFGMLRAITSLQTYGQLTLDHSLYWMTLLAAAGYFAVLGGGELLDRLEGFVRRRSSAPGAVRASLGARISALLSALLGVLADERWVWIAPVVLVLTLYLSVIFQPGRAETGPVMYALF